MLAGYIFVYLTTPYDLAWHVNGSIDRLLIHLWPSTLLAAFLYLGDPTASNCGKAWRHPIRRRLAKTRAPMPVRDRRSQLPETSQGKFRG